MQGKQTRLWNFDQPVNDGDIIAALEAAGEGMWMSRKGIADALRRAKSPTLVARITRLAERMVLVTQLVPLPNGVDMYVYRLNQDYEKG